MWWIPGLIAGLIIGNIIDRGEGAVVGAIFGTLIGLLISSLQRGGRISNLESRVQSLESAVKLLQQDRQAGTPIARSAYISPAPGSVEEALSLNDTGALMQESRSNGLSVPDSRHETASPAPVVDVPLVSSAPSQFDDKSPDINRLWNWLTGGNALVRVGVVVLFFGVAFLLKYAYEHTQLPIELRLTGVALGAVVMLVIGWRLRGKNPVYALAIQGGGVGILYLVVFGAFRLFHLLPGGIAFFLLVALAVLSAILAVAQNAQSLAILGVSGGFLAPVLASTGGGSHVMLFSYYIVLNAGILGIALYKAWRPLNVVGFVFTFGIGSLWGARLYRDEMFATTEPFLVLFFLMYVAIAIIFAFRQAPRLKHYVDATLVFGTPLVGFGMQTRLMQPFEYGAAWSAAILALLYLGLGTVLYRLRRENLRLLVEAFFALGVIFTTLAIPLAVDGRWTSAAWALEGAAAYWVGVRQGRKWPRVFGLLLQFAAGVAFLAEARTTSGDTPVLNTFYMGTVFIALAGLFCNHTIERHAKQVGHTAMKAALALFVWGMAWWVLGGLHEIEQHVPRAERISAALMFLVVSCSVLSLLFARGWWIARFAALGVVPAMAIGAFLLLAGWMPLHPLAGLGVVAWPLAFALHFFVLHNDDSVRTNQAERGVTPLGYVPLAHAAGVWLLALIAARELSWQIGLLVSEHRVWPLVAWALAPIVLIMTMSSRKLIARWPLREHTPAYLWSGAIPLMASLYIWSLVANWTSTGAARPLPYLPFLNPLDIAQMLALLSAIAWWLAAGKSGLTQVARFPANWKWGLFGGLVFYWLNGVLVRTLHHWGGVRHDFGAMMRSALAQTSISIFWTVLALGAMFHATRRGNRVLWLTGAALMAIVVVKMFIFDLSKIGGVERIVSFLAVGVLMLIIGYIAPVPPKSAKEATA